MTAALASIGLVIGVPVLIVAAGLWVAMVAIRLHDRL